MTAEIGQIAKLRPAIDEDTGERLWIAVAIGSKGSPPTMDGDEKSLLGEVVLVLIVDREGQPATHRIRVRTPWPSRSGIVPEVLEAVPAW